MVIPSTLKDLENTPKLVTSEILDDYIARLKVAKNPSFASLIDVNALNSEIHEFFQKHPTIYREKSRPEKNLEIIERLARLAPLTNDIDNTILLDAKKYFAENYYTKMHNFSDDEKMQILLTEVLFSGKINENLLQFVNQNNF